MPAGISLSKATISARGAPVKENKASWSFFVESDGECSRPGGGACKKEKKAWSFFVDSEGPEELMQRLKLEEDRLEQQVPLA